MEFNVADNPNLEMCIRDRIELSSNESEAVLAKPAEGATAITFDIKFTACLLYTSRCV